MSNKLYTYAASRRSCNCNGGSTGMGFETSLMLARNGFHTYATMCKLEDGSRQITDIIFISLLRITLS